MPYASKRPCSHPGCSGMAEIGSRCMTHAKQAQKAKDADRETSCQRGYGRRWQKARAAWLRVHPLCVMCEQEGVTMQANEVDHIVPHEGDMHLFWDSENNWQSLCKRHHSAKTMRESVRDAF